MTTGIDSLQPLGLPGAEDAEQFHAADVSTVAAGHAVNDTYTSFLPPLLPELISKFSLTTAQAGLLSVFLQWPSLLQPFIGYLADSANLRYLVIVAPAVTATAMSLLGIAPSYAVLAMLLIVAGASSAGLHAVGPVMAGRRSGATLGRGMGFWMVGGEIGYTIGPLVLVTVVSLFGLQVTPWLMVGGWLASGVLFIRLKDLGGRPMQAVTPRPWRQALRAMSPVLVPVAGIITARAFMISAMTTYLPVFLRQEGSNLWFAGASLSILEAAGIAGALVGSTSSDRLGRRRVIAASMLITPPLMFLFLGVSGWLRLPLLLLLGFSAMPIMPVVMALVQESFPENRALANGIFMGMTFVIQAAATIILGVLADIVGLQTAFVISAALPLLGVPLILLLPKANHPNAN